MILRRQWQPTPVLLPGKSHGQEEPGRLQSIWVARSRTQLSNFTFTFHFHALEKEMETHSSILAWRIPGTGEPDGLLSVGSHRVGHDWSGLAAAAAATLMIMVSENSFNRNRPLPLYPVCIWQSTSSWFHLTSVQVRWKFWVQVTSTQ